MISVIVHDPDPDPISPITSSEVRNALNDLGYHVGQVLVRQDYAPPCWLVRRLIGAHIGPFSTRLDAVTALELASNADDWDVLGDDEFKEYLDVREERRRTCATHAHYPWYGGCS